MDCRAALAITQIYRWPTCCAACLAQIKDLSSGANHWHDDVMFGLSKPAHVQMRAIIPTSMSRDFDDVLNSFDALILSYWNKGAKDRAVAIVMGEWILGNAEAGIIILSRIAQAKVEHLVALAERFNASDHHGNGSTSTVFAHDFVRAMREGGVIPL